MLTRPLSLFVIFAAITIMTSDSNEKLRSSTESSSTTKRKHYEETIVEYEKETKSSKRNCDETSETQSNHSNDLLYSLTSPSMVPSSIRSPHTNTPKRPSFVRVETETPEWMSAGENRRTITQRRSTDDDFAKMKEKLKEVKDELEEALTFNAALGRKVWKAYRLVASEDEVRDFENELNCKLEDISKVVDKGVELKRFTEYRVVKKED